MSNYLPSISSAISRAPELYIWRSCIGLHSAPRYLVAVAYFNFYRGRFAGRLRELLLSGLALLCSLAENTGLVLLTYVASTEAYSESGPRRASLRVTTAALTLTRFSVAEVHKYGFAVFIGCSLVHMVITCWLWYVIKRESMSPEVT